MDLSRAYFTAELQAIEQAAEDLPAIEEDFTDEDSKVFADADPRKMDRAVAVNTSIFHRDRRTFVNHGQDPAAESCGLGRYEGWRSVAVRGRLPCARSRMYLTVLIKSLRPEI